LQEIGDAIKKIQKEETNPLMVVIQSQQPRLLRHDLPILQDLPMLPLKSDEDDKRLPPLGWQSFVAKRLVGHYLDLGSWITHLIELSRYGNVPLCNLEKDDPRFLIDISYARRLQKEKVVLWWSANPRPDHAGYEKDDILAAMETVDMPSVNNPGTYSSVCIDLSVKNLAINTILCSAVLNDAEGSDSMGLSVPPPNEEGIEDISHVVSGENTFAQAGIMALREMVRAWWEEACRGGGMADVMVQHLVRWIENPGSFLYDKSLHYYVQMMSRKALQQLMSEFRRVGSHVVYASANRLLLQTTKAEVGNAYAYSQYILKTVNAKPSFSFLDLSITEYWDYLIWYDEFNYGGKGCAEVVEAENQTLNTIMEWQIGTFLPNILQPMFNDWVVEYIDLMHTRKRPSSIEGGAAPRPTQLPIHASIFASEKDDQTTPGTILSKSFSKPFAKQIKALIKRQRTEALHTDLAADWEFPSLPGSSSTLTNPTLQLVKSVMQVLSLDKTITLEARLLRKELLQLFEIREFSAEGAFANPSSSLKVRQLSCAECCLPRDIDLCRDSDIFSATASAVSATTTTSTTSTAKILNILCHNCSTPFPNLTIEERLLSEVQKLVLQWQTQDLKCGKCGRIRQNEFMDHCGCAGEWGCTMKREDVVGRLRVFGKVGGAFGMRMLGDVVEGVVGGL
jgi:DNA polymerase epsilon subunit 1